MQSHDCAKYLRICAIVGLINCETGTTGPNFRCLSQFSKFILFLSLRKLSDESFLTGQKNLLLESLDGVAPLITDPPPTSFRTLSPPKNTQKKTWHLTCDMWHVTCDTWHITRDRLGEVNLLSKCQPSSSFGLGIKVFWRYFHKGLTDWPNE